MDGDFDFFNDLTIEQQNSFLKEYLTKTTKYLEGLEFPNSKGCFYYSHAFRDEQYHGNTITNLAVLLLLLVSRDVLLPIRFIGETEIIPAIGTPKVYFIFSDWPVGNLHDDDFYSFKLVQMEELKQYASVLSN